MSTKVLGAYLRVENPNTEP